MPNIPKVALSIFMAVIAFIIGRYVVFSLGVSSRWLIVLGVIIFYIAWWNLRRPPAK